MDYSYLIPTAFILFTYLGSFFVLCKCKIKADMAWLIAALPTYLVLMTVLMHSTK